MFPDSCPEKDILPIADETIHCKKLIPTLPCPENQIPAITDMISDHRRSIFDPSSEEAPNTNPVVKMSMLRMSHHIFTNGMIGAITLIISFGFAASEQVLFGYLENSYIFTSAKLNTIIIGNLF